MACVRSAAAMGLSGVLLNLPTDMQGLDLEAMREWISDKCDHVCRQKQTKLIPGTGRTPTRPPFLGEQRTSSDPGRAERVEHLRAPGFEDGAHSVVFRGLLIWFPHNAFAWLIGLRDGAFNGAPPPQQAPRNL